MIHVVIRHGDIGRRELSEIQKSLSRIVLNYLPAAYREKATDYAELEFVRRSPLDVSRFRFTISIFAPINLSGDAKNDTDLLSNCARKIAKAVHEESLGGQYDFAVTIYPFECVGYFSAEL